MDTVLSVPTRSTFLVQIVSWQISPQHTIKSIISAPLKWSLTSKFLFLLFIYLQWLKFTSMIWILNQSFFNLSTGKNLTGYKSFMNLDKYLIFYKPFPYTHQTFDYYSVSDFIPCNVSCPSCLSSYDYDIGSGKCLKNPNISLIFGSSNISNNLTSNLIANTS